MGKKAHIDIRCSDATLEKWRNLFYEKKRRGMDAEKIFLAMIDAYTRVPEGRYF